MAASEQRKYTSSITNAFFEYEILPELCSRISLGTTSAMNEFREMIWQMNIILKWGDFKSYFCNKFVLLRSRALFNLVLSLHNSPSL